MTTTVRDELQKYVKYLNSLKEVKRIYLFGSHAYGEPGENSDIDLYVTVANGTDKVKTGVKIEMALFDRKLPLDILVNWESEFETANKSTTLQKEIMEKGVLLYEQ